MVHKDEFTPVGMRFFKRGKLPRLRTEGLVCGSCVGSAKTKNAQIRTKNEEPFHSAITLLLSANVSVSTPMRWAMRRSRLLMWASVFAGRLQSW